MESKDFTRGMIGSIENQIIPQTTDQRLDTPESLGQSVLNQLNDLFARPFVMGGFPVLGENDSLINTYGTGTYQEGEAGEIVITRASGEAHTFYPESWKVNLIDPEILQEAIDVSIDIENREINVILETEDSEGNPIVSTVAEVVAALTGTEQDPSPAAAYIVAELGTEAVDTTVAVAEEVEITASKVALSAFAGQVYTDLTDVFVALKNLNLGEADSTDNNWKSISLAAIE